MFYPQYSKMGIQRHYDGIIIIEYNGIYVILILGAVLKWGIPKTMAVVIHESDDLKPMGRNVRNLHEFTKLG